MLFLFSMVGQGKKIHFYWVLWIFKPIFRYCTYEMNKVGSQHYKLHMYLLITLLFKQTEMI